MRSIFSLMAILKIIFTFSRIPRPRIGNRKPSYTPHYDDYDENRSPYTTAISDHLPHDLREFVILVHKQVHLDFFYCESSSYSREAKIQETKS